MSARRIIILPGAFLLLFALTAGHFIPDGAKTMIYLKTCNGYREIGQLPSNFPVDLLPTICEGAEQAMDDGYAVDAWQDSRIIASSDGVSVPDDGPPPYDHATATGMYDRDF